MNIFGSPTFTLFHVIISLIGISFGCLALAALIRNKPISFLNHAFLATTAITVVTGFLFPFNGFDPAIGVGIVSSIALLVAGLALYAGHWSGTSRRAYAISATLALYLNVFVAIVQSFQKVLFLHGAGPSQPSLAFFAVQGFTFICFVALGYFATTRFHPRPALK